VSELSEAELTEAFEYFDALRKSGATNMFAAAPYLVADKVWPASEARQALTLWMATFNDAPVAERVLTARQGTPS
jgi:hypothetical protein